MSEPVSPEWLGLRRDADAAAREPSAPLLRRLADALPPGPLTVIDVGAGTGANQAWLAPRLDRAAIWVLLDHDADLLGSPLHGPGHRVHGTIEELDVLVAGVPDPRLVTCSALLDLLAAAQLDALADTLATHGIPGLFALSVDGGVALYPPDPEDALVDAAFHAHMRRAGRPGPDAPAHLAARCRRHGCQVIAADTPWLLAAGEHPALLERLLAERAAAAAEQEPAASHAIGAWLDRRRATIADRTLRVRVGHRDLLVLPPSG